MLAVLTISTQSLAQPPSSPTLTTMAADHELVLVCDYDTAPSLIRAIRTLLPRHRLVALLIDPDLLRHEHDLLEEILNDGHLPVILTTGEPSVVQLSQWLNAQTDLVLTAEPVPL